MKKVNPPGYLGRQDWLWWALTHVLRSGAAPSPHFHAYHGDDEAVYGLDSIELLAGSLPRRQARLVEAWAELRQSELLADWNRLQSGTEPLPIDPLP